MTLTARQKDGLIFLYERALTHEATDPKLCWAGSREGITGTTIEALERRGLAKSQWVEKPYGADHGPHHEQRRPDLARTLIPKVAAMREP